MADAAVGGALSSSASALWLSDTPLRRPIMARVSAATARRCGSVSCIAICAGHVGHVREAHRQSANHESPQGNGLVQTENKLSPIYPIFTMSTGSCMHYEVGWLQAARPTSAYKAAIVWTFSFSQQVTDQLDLHIWHSTDRNHVLPPSMQAGSHQNMCA